MWIDRWNRLRYRLHKIVEIAEEGDLLSEAYDKLMIISIVASILPLCFKESNIIFRSMEHWTVNVFIVDYFLRWLTVDFRRTEWDPADAFFHYPVTFFAIVDLLSILPSVAGINRSLRLIRLLRLAKSLKTLKLLRYSTGFRVIYKAILKEREPLMAVLWMSMGYIFLSAIIMFSVEPQSFGNFFDAIYWSVVTLTTVGYGDIHPYTDIGRLVSMISSFVGIAVVALPTGIISAGFMSELQQHYSDKEED